MLRNRSFHRLLLAGVPVEFAVSEHKKTDLVHLIDFANPRNNEFLLVNQFTVTGGKQPRRPDLVAFVNGLPLAVLELKNPSNEQTDVWDAFNQLQTYKDEIADLFNCNESLVVSDGWTARVGSLIKENVAPTVQAVHEGLKQWPVAGAAQRKAVLFHDDVIGIALERLTNPPRQALAA